MLDDELSVDVPLDVPPLPPPPPLLPPPPPPLLPPPPPPDESTGPDDTGGSDVLGMPLDEPIRLLCDPDEVGIEPDDPDELSVCDELTFDELLAEDSLDDGLDEELPLEELPLELELLSEPLDELLQQSQQQQPAWWLSCHGPAWLVSWPFWK